MRKLLLCSFIFFSLSLAAQDDFSRQVRDIVKNSSRQFADYKGTFLSLQDKDSVYSSLVTIAGTKKNDLLFAEGMTLYRATIIDSVKIRKGRKIVDEWADRLRQVLGNGFKEEAVKVVEYNPSRYGWRFIKGNTSIDLDVYPYALESEIFWVSFGITYVKE